MLPGFLKELVAKASWGAVYSAERARKEKH